jgi:hypothetical protein
MKENPTPGSSCILLHTCLEHLDRMQNELNRRNGDSACSISSKYPIQTTTRSLRCAWVLTRPRWHQSLRNYHRDTGLIRRGLPGSDPRPALQCAGELTCRRSPVLRKSIFMAPHEVLSSETSLKNEVGAEPAEGS